jgi:hypothetical protein
LPRNFREFSIRGKVLAVGCSVLLVAGLVTATVIVARGSNAGAPPSSATGAGASTSVAQGAGGGGGSTPAPQLPGATTWKNGASSYLFGTNDSINYSTPNVDTLPSVQAYLKQGGLTLMRTWAYDNYSDASIRQRITTIENSGMQCMMMLGSVDDVAWMKHVVSMLGSECNIYEFGNEPDNPTNHTNIAQETAWWVADIPQLRALNPNAVFGGPTVTWSGGTDGSNGSYPSDIAYFLAKTAAAGVRADFISYHDYPCTKSTSTADCLSNTPGDISYNYNQVITWEQQYYGKTVPTGISEYNFDPGSQNLFAWGENSTFMYQWTQTALDAIVATHMAFANEYTTLNYAGYGNLDMFSDSAPYGPKAQFYGIVASVEKYGGQSTVPIPNPLP